MRHPLPRHATGPARGRAAPVAAALALFAGLAAGLPLAAAAGEEGNPQFDTYCIACHGPDARGIQGLGVDLVTSKFVAGKDEAALVAFLKAGRLPDDPASRTGRPMPGFAWVPEGELQAVAAFLKARSGAR